MTQISSFIEKIVADLEASTTDVESAITNPHEIYKSEEFYEFEKEAIFLREWLAVGHQNQIPNPGDYFSLTIVDEPIIVVRNHDGEINALSGVCRHRGYPLTKDEPHVKGNCQSIVCPYHNWSYDLNGEIETAPHMGKTIDLETLRATMKLPKFRVEVVQGIVFINFDSDAAPLKPTVAKWEKEMANYNLANLKPVPTIVAPDNGYNWKILHENGLEPYHTMYVHAGYHDTAPALKATFMEFEDGDNQVMHPTGFVEFDGGFNPTGKSVFPILPNLNDVQRSQVLFGSVLPTVLFAALPDQVFLFFIIPTGPAKTTLMITWLFPESTHRWRNFQWAFDAQSSANDVFNVQDIVANTELQRGLNSRFGTRGRYSHLEKTLPQMNRWLYLRLRRYIDERRSKAA